MPCRSGCGARRGAANATKEAAKTIDLCNNPLTKEPKLEGARRIVAEWPALDAEQLAFTQQVCRTHAACHACTDARTVPTQKLAEARETFWCGTLGIQSSMVRAGGQQGWAWHSCRSCGSPMTSLSEA